MESLSTQVIETATNAQSIDASLIISIISLAISLFVFAKDLWHERLRIDVALVKWFASIVNGQPFFLWLVIQNNSSLPFSISKIELTGRRNDLNLYAESHGNKRLIASETSNDSTKDVYSLDYPIIVNAYEGVGGYFHFTSDFGHFNFENQTVSLTIYTNRGIKKIKNIRLNRNDNIMRAWLHLEKSNYRKENSKDSSVQYTKEPL